MPCKIKIKQHVENLVEQKSQPGLSMSLQDAQILSANINSEFMHHVVSFKNENDIVKRVINIPSKLVDTYYDLQVKKEIVNTPFNNDDLLYMYNNIDISNAEKNDYKIVIDDDLYLNNSEAKDSYYGYWINIMSNGKNVGRVRFEQRLNFINEENPSVKTFSPNIQIYDEVDQKKGIGTKVHLAIYKYVKSIYPNYLFVSDTQNTVAEIGLLKSFEKKGITTQINPIGELDKKYNNYYVVKNPPFIFNDDYFKEKQDVSGLNSDINSLNLTPEVVNYLYRSSRSKSKNVSLESYTKEVKKLIDNLRTSYTNEEILEKIKCL
jgi:hypothetical protein